MIYTLGSPESYRKYLDQAGITGVKCLKKGKTIDYTGGYAFKTPEEAKMFASRNNLPFTVFELDSTWDNVDEGTIPLLGHASLIGDSGIVGEVIFSSSSGTACK